MGAELWRSLDIFGIWNSLGNRVGVFFFFFLVLDALWLSGYGRCGFRPPPHLSPGFSFLVCVLELFHLESQHALGFGMCQKYLQGMNRRCQNRGLRESSSAKHGT